MARILPSNIGPELDNIDWFFENLCYNRQKPPENSTHQTARDQNIKSLRDFYNNLNIGKFILYYYIITYIYTYQYR